MHPYFKLLYTVILLFEDHDFIRLNAILTRINNNLINKFIYLLDYYLCPILKL